MNKPNNYENTQVGNDYTPVDLGGHRAVIKKVEERDTRTGKPMVVIAIDFDSRDKQPGYFMQQFTEDTRPDKKWPNQAMLYIVTEDGDGNCSRNFKSFITSYEKSNNVSVAWGENFAAQFTNKKIGVVFGEVEEEYNGEVKTRRKIRWTCEYDKASTANIPKFQELKRTAAVDQGFINVPDVADDEIPF